MLLIIILMETTRPKLTLARKPNPPLNPELTAAQMTLGRTGIAKPLPNQQHGTLNVKEVLEEVESLWIANDTIESIKLMKELAEYLRGSKHEDQQMLAQVHTNLAVSYYKIGFLEEAYEEFSNSLSILKEATLGMRGAGAGKGQQLLTKQALKLKYDMLTARIQLQVCILFSEMGKHQDALAHARAAGKLSYNMIYDLLILLYQHLLTYLSKARNNYANAYAPDSELTCEGHQDLINNVATLEQLVSATKDFKQQFIPKQKSQLLQQQRLSVKKIGKLPSHVDIDLLYALTPENIDSLWVFKNKILDEIQMKFIKEDSFDTSKILENHQSIQKIVYLAISLYCYSTETRFLEKDKTDPDPSQVLDSEHWLSRSLEIAYSFLPQEAPILNQILTVHDRFHGIDKQTIPEDKEIGGFFKVLRPLSKPKSTYSSSSKSNLCSPIMIRIQIPKIDLEINDMGQDSSKQIYSDSKHIKMHSHKIEMVNKTIDLDSLTKNNKIRGLNTNKKYDFVDNSQSTIRHKTNTKTDFTEHLKNIYASRKIKSVAEHSKNDRMKINLKGISSQLDSESKSMRRPHSYDKEIDRAEQMFPLKTERKKKSMSLHKNEHSRRRSSTTYNSSTLKLDGLQMLPKKNMEDQQFEFSGRIANVGTTKIGGNIFINNNINLFISKQESESKEIKSKNTSERTVYEMGRRQAYLNKRRSHNSVFSGGKHSDLLQ